MSQTTSDFLITRLKTWGVRRIYGYPADGINGSMRTSSKYTVPRPVKATVTLTMPEAGTRR